MSRSFFLVLCAACAAPTPDDTDSAGLDSAADDTDTGTGDTDTGADGACGLSSI